MPAAPPLPLAPAGVSPQDAARAYRAVDQGAGAGAAAAGAAAAAAAGAAAADFGDVLAQALQGAVRSGRQAEAQAARAIAGGAGADLTEVVQAVSRAELTLQTATAIRDRVVQAYQDIMKMPI
jgi:flagellar hook-basal body complex protein FliE